MIANRRSNLLSRPDHKIVDRTKIRDGQVANRLIYMALAVTAEDTATSSACGPATAAKARNTGFECSPRSRIGGVEDVLMLVCDGLKGLPDAVGEVWPRTVVQTCVVHLLRASFRYAARQDWDKIAKALKPVYTAPTEDAATTRFLEFAETWGKKYPAVVRLWESSWPEFTSFLQFDAEIRRIVCTTNSIESVNARIRKAVRSRGHFPTEQAALKCVYMAVMSLDPTGAGRKRWTMRWKGAMNAFDLAFDGRLTAGQL
ncbi:transposase [Streptomyces sp. NBC_01622]|uniref:IS256 family transposase n=1 Tax=Streptomyces sp. NBC_01622 TaxID=2975903 RepID=UPI0038684C70|nr:transposase [Streptomyces sp. NBC_01622]